MSSQPQSEKTSLPRLLVGLGFFLIFLAVGIGAALKGAGDFPKYLAGAAVVIIFAGGIAGVLQGRMHRGH
jgi:hypothetical protein